jgi:hypothetical protein
MTEQSSPDRRGASLVFANLARPSVLLRLEGVALLLLALLLYRELGASWWLFLGLILLPDLGIAAYLAGPRIGAHAYNALHTTLLPAALFGAGYVAERGTAMAVALVWAAHIGADRVLGFGLKYEGTAFRDSHLQRV